MSNFTRYLYGADPEPVVDPTPPAGPFRVFRAYASQMLVAAGFAALGFYLFFQAPHFIFGLMFWNAGIVFGAHFADKTYDRIRFVGA